MILAFTGRIDRCRRATLISFPANCSLPENPTPPPGKVAGRLDLRGFGNGIQTDYTYNPWTMQGGRLQELKSGTASDPAGNLDGIYNEITDENHSYGYDTLDRLTSWTLSSLTEDFTKIYRYDSATGNLITNGGSAFTLESMDSNHRHAGSSAGGNSYPYEANRNMVKRFITSGPLAGTYALGYDAENRLAPASSPTGMLRNAIPSPGGTAGVT